MLPTEQPQGQIAPAFPIRPKIRLVWSNDWLTCRVYLGFNGQTVGAFKPYKMDYINGEWIMVSSYLENCAGMNRLERVGSLEEGIALMVAWAEQDGYVPDPYPYYLDPN